MLHKNNCLIKSNHQSLPLTYQASLTECLTMKINGEIIGYSSSESVIFDKLKVSVPERQCNATDIAFLDSSCD